MFVLTTLAHLPLRIVSSYLRLTVQQFRVVVGTDLGVVTHSNSVHDPILLLSQAADAAFPKVAGSLIGRAVTYIAATGLIVGIDVIRTDKI